MPTSKEDKRNSPKSAQSADLEVDVNGGSRNVQHRPHDNSFNGFAQNHTNELRNLRNHIHRLTEEVETIKMAAYQNEEIVNELQEQIKAKDQEIEISQSENSKIQLENEKLVGQVDELQAKFGHLETQYDQELKNLRQQCEAIKGEIASVRKENEQIMAEFTAKEKDLTDMLNVRVAELADTQRTSLDLQNHLEDCKREKLKLESFKDKFERREEDYERQLNALRSELQQQCELSATLAREKNELESAKQQVVEEGNLRVDELDKTVFDLKEQLNALRSDLEQQRELSAASDREKNELESAKQQVIEDGNLRVAELNQTVLDLKSELALTNVTLNNILKERDDMEKTKNIEISELTYKIRQAERCFANPIKGAKPNNARLGKNKKAASVNSVNEQARANVAIPINQSTNQPTATIQTGNTTAIPQQHQQALPINTTTASAQPQSSTVAPQIQFQQSLPSATLVRPIHVSPDMEFSSSDEDMKRDCWEPPISSDDSDYVPPARRTLAGSRKRGLATRNFVPETSSSDKAFDQLKRKK